MSTDPTTASIVRVLCEHEATKRTPAWHVMDLADKIAAVIDRDAPTDAQVCAHPLYREQVGRTQDAQRYAARERDRLKRRLEQVEGERDRARDLVADLVAIDERGTEREECTGPVAEEPTDLGAVIVASSVDHPGDVVCVRVDCSDNGWLCGDDWWAKWSDLTATRWATATERATGKVDPEQDEDEPTGWEPGADVTDRIDQAPEGVVMQDRDGDLWCRTGGAWRIRLTETWVAADDYPADYAPLTVATAEQLRAAGILTGSEQ